MSGKAGQTPESRLTTDRSATFPKWNNLLENVAEIDTFPELALTLDAGHSLIERST
jgi:hypothetical protein